MDLDLDSINDILKASGLSGFRVVNEDDNVITSAVATKISNSLTSLENSLNKIYTHTHNAKNLHEAENRRFEMLARENALEETASKSGSAINTSAVHIDITRFISATAGLNASLIELGSALQRMPGGGSGGSNAGAIGDLAAEALGKSKSLAKFAKFAPAAAAAVDFGVSVAEGKDVVRSGVRASGTAAGAWAGAEAGAAVGGAIGSLFFGAGAVPGAAIGGVIGGIGGSIFGGDIAESAYDEVGAPLDGARAQGGPVAQGKSYLVGERGPEIFTPDEDGNITPNKSGGPPTILKIVVVDQHPSSSQLATSQKEFADSITKSMDKSVKDRSMAKAREESAAFGKRAEETNTFMNFVGGLFDRFKSFLGIGQGGGGPIGAGAGSTENAQKAFAFFQSTEGGKWTPEQAAAIVGNLQYESGDPNLSPSTENRQGSGAYGIAQWLSRDRVEEFERVFKRPLRGSTFEQQLQFVAYELANNEKKAGEELRKATTVEEATRIFQRGYERAGAQGLESENRRISNALAILSGTADGGNVIKGSGTGSISGAYGTDRGDHIHGGIDIRANAGTPVSALQNGTVTRAGVSSTYGNVVYISQDNGFETRYAHLRGIAPGIRVGTKVAAAQIIGEVGSTGRSTGNHLHFEVRKNGQDINPTDVYNRNTWIVGGEKKTPVQASTVNPGSFQGYKVVGGRIRTPHYSIPMSATSMNDPYIKMLSSNKAAVPEISFAIAHRDEIIRASLAPQ